MTLRDRARLWLREPLVHFLLIGALVYALLSGRPADPGERRIVVDRGGGHAAGRTLVAQSFRRAPTQAEIDGLIRDYVKDEVYYREALRLGLDRDDEAVRRLMRNKMVALVTADAEARQPERCRACRRCSTRIRRAMPAEVSFDFDPGLSGRRQPGNAPRRRRVLAELERGGSDQAGVTRRPAAAQLRRGAATSDVASAVRR